MDSYKKLSEELLKTDGIDPVNIPDSEHKMFEQLLDKHLNSGKSNQALWRIIMKSKITKFAAAAVVIIAIFFILNNSSVDITSNLYAEITENMQKMPWVYIRIIIESPTETDESKRTAEVDLWYSDIEQVRVLKESLSVDFFDYQEGKKYDYNPDKNSITVSSINQADYSNTVIDLQNGIDSWFKQFSQSHPEVEINHHSEEFEGEKVEIYEYQVEKGSAKIYVNSVSRLPICAEFIDIYKNEPVNTQFRFEFPESGPKDIYDLGVPRDAPIIQKTPEENQ